jgi:hypothetical protein
MVAKGGGGKKRDCHGQRGAITALEGAEAFWIWTTKMHATKGGGKQEEGGWGVHLLAVAAAIAVTESSPGDKNK